MSDNMTDLITFLGHITAGAISFVKPIVLSWDKKPKKQAFTCVANHPGTNKPNSDIGHNPQLDRAILNEG